jgi:hypothetical protein
VTRSICAVFLLALAYPAFAQVNPQFADVSDEIEMVRSLVRIERKAAVEQAMQLAPAESQAFWTLYNEYEAERILTSATSARKRCSLKHSTSTPTSSASKRSTPSVSRRSCRLLAWRDSFRSSASWTRCRT